MITRGLYQTRLRDEEYRGVWSGNIVTLSNGNNFYVDSFAPKDELDVIVVVVGGYLIAETLQNVEVG